MTEDIYNMYGAQFFEDHQALKRDYDIVADSLLRVLDFDSAVDFGCGNGFLLSRFKVVGKEVLGLDGSKAVLDACPPNLKESIQIADLRSSMDLSRKFDLVICSEVGEHLEERFADGLVDTVVRHAQRYIYFTAAIPGQTGYGHVNEQPHKYWIKKFDARGWVVDGGRTNRLRTALYGEIRHTHWFTWNSIIYITKTAQGVHDELAKEFITTSRT